MSDVHTNPERLWSRLMDMAEVGATPARGSNRQALSDDDRAGRELFVGWAERAGCSIELDGVGNLFARRDGTDPDALPVVLGSHLDTQPTGGRFDGVYGVLGGLEVVEALKEPHGGVVVVGDEDDSELGHGPDPIAVELAAIPRPH